MTALAFGEQIPLLVILESGANNKVVKANIVNALTGIDLYSNLVLTYITGSTGRYLYSGSVTMPNMTILVQYFVYEANGTTLIQEDGETIELLPGDLSPIMGYITLDQVKLRLEGKVRFTTSVDDENRMLESLARSLMREAEGQVEMDLSERYFAPFQTIDGKTFPFLPDRPTKQVLTNLCLAMAVMRILDTDFGMGGGSVDSGKYYEKLEARYKADVAQILEKRNGEGSTWRYPPMPGLKLNYQNQTDDGFVGAVLVVSGSDAGSYPAGQVNNPSVDLSDLYNGGDD